MYLVCDECDNELNYSYYGEKGAGIIFVNKNFETLPTRVGAEKDMERLKDIYKKYNICYEDKTKGVKNFHMDVETKYQLMEKVQTFAKSVSKDCPAIFVSISTHGGEQGKLKMPDGYALTVDEMVSPFVSEELIGIPKVFIFQACRGGKADLAYGDSDGDEEQDPPRYATQRSDIILIYSTYEGYKAFRGGKEEDGSWFIQMLHTCVMTQAYKNLHLVEILTVCSSLVIDNYQKELKKEKEVRKKKRYVVTQTPTYTSTLTKFLRFPVS